jgi:hypothetical protein
MWWNIVHRYRSDPASGIPHQIGHIFSELLGQLGVQAVPPRPETTSEELEGDRKYSAALLGNAISPITYRGLVSMLMSDLPAATLQIVSALLWDRAKQGDSSEAKLDGLAALRAAPDEPLDACPPRPVISLNLHASGRAITKDVETLVQDLKKQHQIPEVRHRTDILERYLAAWDLREGWTGSGYDITKERSFSDIAAALGQPERTVANNYYAAFQIIGGYRYTVETWVRVFWGVKLDQAKGNRSLGRRGPIRGKSTAVTEPDHKEDADVPAAATASPEDVLSSLNELNSDFAVQLLELVDAAYNNAAILRKLNLPDTQQANDFLDSLRRRRREEQAHR